MAKDPVWAKMETLPIRSRGRPRGNPTPFTAAERRVRNAQLEHRRRGVMAGAYSELREALGLDKTATRSTTIKLATAFLKSTLARTSLADLRRQNAAIVEQIQTLEKSQWIVPSKTEPMEESYVYDYYDDPDRDTPPASETASPPHIKSPCNSRHTVTPVKTERNAFTDIDYSLYAADSSQTWLHQYEPLSPLLSDTCLSDTILSDSCLSDTFLSDTCPDD